METFIKTANMIKEELKANGYDADIGINRITGTINIQVNKYGSPQIEKIIPPVIEPLESEDNDDTYLYTINDHEKVNQFIDEAYDTDEFNT